MKFIKANIMIIESIIYILLLILLIYLNINGSILLKFFPTLFFMGIVGNVIFNKPVITSAFSFVISITFIQFLTNNTLQDNGIYSIYIMSLVGLGEAVGYFIKHLKYNTSKKNKLKNSNAIVYSIVITLVAILLNNYVQGSLYDYIMSKNKLTNYLEEKYNFTDIKIYGIEYENYLKGSAESLITNYNKCFKFKVYINNEVYYYYANNDLVIDKYQETFNLVKVYKLNSSLKRLIDNGYIGLNEGYNTIITSNNDIFKYDLKIEYECRDMNNHDELQTFLTASNDILKKIIVIYEFEKINGLQLKYKVGDEVKVANISKEHFFDIKKYTKAFETEFLEG